MNTQLADAQGTIKTLWMLACGIASPAVFMGMLACLVAWIEGDR